MERNKPKRLHRRHTFVIGYTRRGPLSVRPAVPLFALDELVNHPPRLRARPSAMNRSVYSIDEPFLVTAMNFHSGIAWVGSVFVRDAALALQDLCLGRARL